MVVLTRIGTALAIVLAAACDFVPDPVVLEDLPDRVTVHSLIFGGQDSVSVLIIRPARADDATPGDVEPVSGAVAEVVAPDGAIELTEDLTGAPVCFRAFGQPPDGEPPASAGPGCYAAPVPDGVRVGRPYGLRVRLPDGNLVEGEAVALAPPAIHEPAEDTAVVLGADVLGNRFAAAVLTPAWTAPGAALARIGLSPGAVFRGGEMVPDAVCGMGSYVEDRDPLNEPATDSVRVTMVVDEPHCTVPDDSLGRRPLTDWDSLQARFRVTVFDSTYASYHREVIEGGNSISADYASAGLHGAPGVFAGAAVAERRVTLIASDDDASGASPSPHGARSPEGAHAGGSSR